MGYEALDDTALRLPVLESVGGDFVFGGPSGSHRGSWILVAPALKSITGTLALTNIRWITELTFTSLAHVGGDVQIGREEACDGSVALQDFRGFSRLRTIRGSLRITGNRTLDTLAGFEQLRSIGKELSIRANYTLKSIAALKSLETVGGSVTLGAFAKRLRRRFQLGAVASALPKGTRRCTQSK